MAYQEIVKKLELKPHPEGGYFRETYRSKAVIPQEVLGKAFSSERNFCAAIYFLLTSENFSAFHRLHQDELWHFYSGDPLLIHVINELGEYQCHEIGHASGNNLEPQALVPAGCWFASSVKSGGTYSLVGCTVAPGFDFGDFELADRTELTMLYPEYADVIRKFTRLSV